MNKLQDRRTRVKICGLRDVETIRAMNGLPLDEIGFLFAKSRREVSPQLAGELIREVHKLRTPAGSRPHTVGVFVDTQLEILRELLKVAPLDVVQLHGDESPELCAAIREELGVEVWKVFSVTESEQLSDDSHSKKLAEGPLRLDRYQGTLDAVLIDTAGGGTGQAFAWHVIQRYAEAAARIGVPLYVAGGLHPDNVGELLENYTPSGVDVSSGVETEGIKDIDKIRRFVERVNQA
ncbi:N-(5'-phosphoribosyl)anthranilate isomerase [Paenibacillus baekrokdamisoli]|uniref:N-(5'-phosphoribosyl)anthranilate isomerase n=1 Tax=Paenibacillus baekrokdamisoli TaxID=1712516 RepID=A0A3G9IRQ3_9BACL|nr:phosphoribosylanthranilate isomerase [Paenibacillus baekrokdamisoli]MBB3069664.1 phosphoribosylanthranilate isomerase [Paenibacillus baekrokdamisoli]BBH20982.1 N-(5'-phosphoribosyl)anthranilate isomerase [Paenibacillus baekrokdamisoli]